MSGPSSDPAEKDQLLHEAATWFARMRGPDAEADREQFEAWLKRGALHRQAYNRASEIFAMGKLLAEDAGSDDRAAPSHMRPRGRTFAFALGTLAILIAASWLLLGPLRSSETAAPPIADAEQAGDRLEFLSAQGSSPRSFRLADGSMVTLQPGSELEVRFGPGERRLDLREGQARFEVSRETRPFAVHAGGGRVVATGTVFEVGYAGERRVVVRLLEGAVEVTPPARDPQAQGSQRLRAGEQTSYHVSPAASWPGEPERSSAAVLPPEPSAAPAAGDNGTARDYDNVPVGDLVALANREGRRAIRLAEPSIAALRVSGRFRVDHPPLLAERLIALFDLVRVDSANGDIVLRRR